MKTNIFHFSNLLLMGALALTQAGVISAQNTTTTTTTTITEKEKPTTAEGVVGLWQSDRFELNTVKNGTMKFLYSQETEFVDLDDKRVDAIRLKPGVSVTVRFGQEGDRLLAKRITVHEKTVEVKR